MVKKSTKIHSSLRTVEWKNNRVVMIDQTKLPNKLVFVEYSDFQEIANAIKTLVVRGAPAIGVSGAFGLVLAALQSNGTTKEELIEDLEKAKKILFETRPTAVNLQWGLETIMKVANKGNNVSEIKESVVQTAKKMAEDDVQINMTMGKHGSELFNDNDTIMTHCNAGALATVAYGTALGVIRATRDSGKNIKVIATETRPVQQGSRLTAFELKHDGIDVSLIPDTAVGYSMAQGLVNKVIVGADRILRTGHVYNKIGTYQVATMAKQHGIPFYVAAPLSTFDLQSNPEDVIIEQRNGSEVTGIGDKKTAPDGINVINPAFDMTPPELISGIITEKGIAKSPFEESIKKLFQNVSEKIQTL
ncbi:MAG: S-methyl-5-thioribose-1-phosphate isomerase [Nitrososphaeraceae archaeon]